MNPLKVNVTDLATCSTITPEMFSTNPSKVSIPEINACLEYAKINNTSIVARGVYIINESIELDSVRWVGGKITGTGSILITNSTLEGCDIDRVSLEIKGGCCTIANNKIHNQTTVAALLIKDISEPGRINCVYNEFYDCNYAILQQGTGDFKMLSGIMSFNTFHDTRGDAIELNVINSHYSQGLSIEGNIISNVDGAGPNWGIGIGISGKGPYGIDNPDTNYASNFTIKGNHITACRQCIHTELCRSFSITDNICYPDITKSVDSGIISGAVVSYGCKDFVIRGLNGDPLLPSTRFLVIDWGNNDGSYAGPPLNFTIQDINTLNGNVEISTAGSDNWLNTTIVENIRCNTLMWRGLPSASVFRNIYSLAIDCIGQHSDGEGSGGGVFTRHQYIYSQWVNVSCLNEPNVNTSITKMFVDKLIEAGNNFPLYTSSDNGNNRGPQLSPTIEQYLLPDSSFPQGREFSKGSILWKPDGGYFVVRIGGASITGTNEIIRPVQAGSSYIQTANYDWSLASHSKSAGTQIIINGAGENGGDLITTISRATYVLNGRYTIDIQPGIVTTVNTTTRISAANPIDYKEVNLP